MKVFGEPREQKGWQVQIKVPQIAGVLKYVCWEQSFVLSHCNSNLTDPQEPPF